MNFTNEFKERMTQLVETYQFEKTDNGNFRIIVNGFEMQFIDFSDPNYLNIIHIFRQKHQEVISLVWFYHGILAKYKDQNMTQEIVREIQPTLEEILYLIYNIFENVIISNNWDSKEVLDKHFNGPLPQLLMTYLNVLDCIYISALMGLKSYWEDFSNKNPEVAKNLHKTFDQLYEHAVDSFDLNKLKPIGNA